MPQTIYEQATAEYSDDKHLVLTGKTVLVQQLPLAATWNQAKIGVQFSFWPDPSGDTTPVNVANVELVIGFCKSGVNHPGVTPASGMDTAIGWRFGTVGALWTAGDTWVEQDYSGGDVYYSASTGSRLISNFSGSTTLEGTSAKHAGMKCFRNYDTRRGTFFMELADYGANWKAHCNYVESGTSTFNSGCSYGEMIKGTKSPLHYTTTGAMRLNDYSFQPRSNVIATFAQDNTRGRPDSMFILFRDWSATGAALVVSARSANCSEAT